MLMLHRVVDSPSKYSVRQTGLNVESVAGFDKIIEVEL